MSKAVLVKTSIDIKHDDTSCYHSNKLEHQSNYAIYLSFTKINILLHQTNNKTFATIKYEYTKKSTERGRKMRNSEGNCKIKDEKLSTERHKFQCFYENHKLS